eukprot:12380629-Ditylum_brightwellii.AAC.1
MESHLHSLDGPKQGAATTNVHMDIFLNSLISREALQKKGIIWDDTVGCGKQYRCARVFWLLSYLSQKYNKVIDQAIAAPVHGKGLVDRIGAIDKSFL